MKSKTYRYTSIALLSAVAFVLQFFEFSVPLPFIPTFLKMDASDIPAVFAMFTVGGVGGILVQLIKNILHALFFGWSSGLGELSNLIVGTGLILPYLIAKKRGISLVSVVVSGLISMVTICVAGFASNCLITPIYTGMPLDGVLAIMPGILAFNAIKAALVMVIMIVIRIPLKKLVALRT